MTTVTLPWPSPILHPNARPHWAAKAKAAKTARVTAGWAVTAETGGKFPQCKQVAVSVTFCPPDKRRRDMDGMIASMKAAQDGISDAIGIDDHFFVPTYAFGAPVKGGAVRVEITPIHTVTES